MKLIACGDSWCWGAELVDPVEEPVPIFKLGGDNFDRQLKPINMAYREKHRYIQLFKDKIQADELVDLSQPSISNTAIARKLKEYLCLEGYLSGRDTSELFVSIGWSSPERNEFYYKDPDTGHVETMVFGPWVFSVPNKDPALDQFLKTYALMFCHEHEFMHRWIKEVFETQLLLQHYKIKFVMHQAFYHFLDEWFNTWQDNKYLERSMSVISTADKKLWELVDNKTFMHKDRKIMSAHNIMQQEAKIQFNDPDKAFIIMHPSEFGHSVWAQHMYDYCIKSKIL
jgi:hypothetical protein